MLHNGTVAAEFSRLDFLGPITKGATYLMPMVLNSHPISKAKLDTYQANRQKPTRQIQRRDERSGSGRVEPHPATAGPDEIVFGYNEYLHSKIRKFSSNHY